MKKNIAYNIIIIIATFTYGVIVGKYEVFPYELIVKIKHVVVAELHAPIIKPRVTQFSYFHPQREIVMIGDSITQGGIWSEIFPNVSIANRGVWGDTSADILRRMDTIFNVNSSKAFIMLGYNDITNGLSVSEILVNYEEIIEKLRYKNTEVIIQSTLECSITKCSEKLKKIRELNQKLESYANRNSLVFININKELSTEDEGLLLSYTRDGVHLLGGGYSVWAASIAEYMK